MNFLETTPVCKGDDPWHVQAALLIAWITNAPEVTVSLDEKIVAFGKKNPALLIIFMGGYAR